MLSLRKLLLRGFGLQSRDRVRFPKATLPTVASTHSVILPQTETGLKSKIATGATVTATIQAKPQYNDQTVLLLHGEGANLGTTITDSGFNNYTFINNGGLLDGTHKLVTVTAQKKWGTSAIYNYNGSIDGSAYSLLYDDTSFNFGTGDFTVEAWVRPTLAGAGSAVVALHDSGFGSGFVAYSIWELNISGTNVNFFGSNAGVGQKFLNGLTSMSINTWHHVAVTRQSGTIYLFLDGVLDNSSSTQFNGVDLTCPANTAGGVGPILTIGNNYDYQNDIANTTATVESGRYYFDDVRVIKGVALYTANFTVPSAAFPDPVPNSVKNLRAGAAANASATGAVYQAETYDAYYNSVGLLLKMNGTNGGTTFVDSSPGALTTTGFNVTTTTATTRPNDPSSAAYTLATNGLIKSAHTALIDFGTGDFTIELWVNIPTPSYADLLSLCGGTTESGESFRLTYSDPNFNFIYGVSNFSINRPLVANTWTHVAVVRIGTGLYMYVDRSLINSFFIGTAAIPTISIAANPYIYIGGMPTQATTDAATAIITAAQSGFTGFIDEVRITKGVGRYTAAGFPLADSFGTAAVPSGTLNSNAAAVTTLTATLAVQAFITLASDAAGRATGTAALNVVGGMFANAAAVSTSTAALAKVVTFAATPAATATVVAAFTTVKTLGASAAAVATCAPVNAPFLQVLMPDPYYSYVSLLCIFSNTETTTDETGGQTISLNTDHTTKSQNTLFMDPNGATTSSGFTAAPAQNYDFGSGDFTVEFLYKNYQSIYNTTLLRIGNGTNNFVHGGDFAPEATYGVLSIAPRWYVGVANNGLYTYMGVNGSLIGMSVGNPIFSAIQDNNWHHYALTRKNGLFTFFIDGVPISRRYASGPMNSSFNAGFGGILSLGNDYDGAATGINGPFPGGNWRNLRVTKGISRYNDTFTPETNRDYSLIPATAIPNQVTLSTQNGDDNLASVNVLLHGEGTAGSTTLTNSKSGGAPVTAFGNVQLSNAQAKFGTTSIATDGASSSYFSFNEPVDIPITSDLTIEFWVYSSGTPVNGTTMFKIAKSGAGGNALTLAFTSATTLAFDGIGFTFTSNTWHHVAISVFGWYSYLWLDGALVANSTSPQNLFDDFNLYVPKKLGGDWCFGGVASGTNFVGFFDDVRVTKGVARYQTPFAPPARVLPDDSYSGYTPAVASMTVAFATGGTVTMAANAASVATQTGAITVGKLLASGAASVASVTATATWGVGLAAAAQDVATATAALGLSISLAAAPAGVATGTMTLTVTNATLASAAAAIATVNATLNVGNGVLAAAPVSVATATATVSLATPLAATPAATATATAAMALAITTAGAGAGVATATASLFIAKALDTAAAASAQTTAVVAIGKALASSALAVASGTADLKQQPLYTPDPRRAFIVVREDRVLLVSAEARLVQVPAASTRTTFLAQSGVLVVAAEDRKTTVSAEVRKLSIQAEQNDTISTV